MNMQYPEGTIPCPPYLERRLIIQIGPNSVDLMRRPENPVWRDAFRSDDIDWKGGWRVLWEEAATLLGTGSDYVQGRVALEVQAYFANGEMGCIGAIIDCDDNDIVEIDVAARRLLFRVCNGDEIADGCIGLISHINDPFVRPSLTLLVSGPGGGTEAAMIIRRELVRWGVNAGVAIRTIRNGDVGVLKIPFLPETYLKLDHSCFGIQWELWRALAGRAPTFEWNSACLLWCNTIIECVQGLKAKAGLMIDDLYFDAMRIIPFSLEASRNSIYTDEEQIGRLLSQSPSKFLFDEDVA